MERRIRLVAREIGLNVAQFRLGRRHGLREGGVQAEAQRSAEQCLAVLQRHRRLRRIEAAQRVGVSRGDFGGFDPGPQHDVDHAADRIARIERGRGNRQHFDPLDETERDEIHVGRQPGRKVG